MLTVGGTRVSTSKFNDRRESRVRVTVRLFAALRERAGAGQRELELPEGATAGDVFAALAIGAEPPGLAYAVNREYAERTLALQRRRRGRGDPARLGRRATSRSSCSARSRSTSTA